MNATSPSAFGSLINIFLEPRKTLEDVRGHTNWLWYPLVLSVVSIALVFVWYYASADWDVIRQQQTDILTSYNVPKDKIAESLASLTRGKLIIQTTIGIVVVYALIYFIQTLYLFLVGKVVGSENQSFGSWFNFTAWTYFPSFLGAIASMIAILVYGKQATATAIDVTSLNTLFFKLTPDNSWFGLLNSMHLALFWTLALMTIGFAAWTKRSLGKSAAIVLAPHVLIYGLWILFKLI